MNEDILSLIKTKKETDRLVFLIDSLIESIYERGGENFERLLSEEASEEISRALKEGLKSFGGDRQEYLRTLKERLNNLQEVKLTLSFKPSEKTILKIFQWIKANLGENVIMNLAVNKRLIGGVQVSFKGNYGDYSLKKKFENRAIFQNINS